MTNKKTADRDAVSAYQQVSDLPMHLKNRSFYYLWIVKGIGQFSILAHQRVVGLEQAGEGWHVRTTQSQTFPADFLVGADGVRSIVRRRVVGPIPRQHLAMAMGYRVRGAPDALVFQTFSDLEGYLWSFPRAACPEQGRGNHASVGIGTRVRLAIPREPPQGDQ